MWFALLHILQLKLPWACMYRWESCSECPPLPFLLGVEAFCPMHLTCESTCNVFSTHFQETPKSIFFSVSANVFLFTGYKPHLTPGICQLPVTTAPAKSADAWSLWGAKALHCSAYVWCCSFFPLTPSSSLPNRSSVGWIRKQMWIQVFATGISYHFCSNFCFPHHQSCLSVSISYNVWTAFYDRSFPKRFFQVQGTLPTVWSSMFRHIWVFFYLPHKYIIFTVALFQLRQSISQVQRCYSRKWPMIA